MTKAFFADNIVRVIPRDNACFISVDENGELEGFIPNFVHDLEQLFKKYDIKSIQSLNNDGQHPFYIGYKEIFGEQLFGIGGSAIIDWMNAE